MSTAESVSLTPGLKSFLASLKGKPVNASVDHLATLLRRRQIWGARRCAIATANLLINVVAAHKSRTSEDLRTRVREVARRLAEAQPLELTIGNVARRILSLIRDASEGSNEPAGKDGHPSNVGNGDAVPSGNDNQIIKKDDQLNVKEDVLDGIRELLDELDQADKQISEYSIDHVFPEETLLIFGGSHTVQRFLLDVAKRRRIRVFSVEGYPNEHEAAHEVAMQGATRDIDDPVSSQNRLRTLAAAGVQVTIITDSQVFAVMPMVSKVVLSAQGVFSNGGGVFACGTKGVSATAKFHRTPVLALGAIYRLSPTFPYDPRTLVEPVDPSASTSFQDGLFLDQVKTPRYGRDYIPPDLISLFVTNVGGSIASQMYRLASDHYRSQDVEL